MTIKPLEFIEIEVDGKPMSVPKDQVLLWSLRDRGVDIPHFCAHKWLEPFAGCRMCLVEIEMGGRMMPKLQPSCAMKPAEGMKVFTQTDKVRGARREQIEFHLINHPLECPICDKGGECMLQDQVYDHGADEGRYSEEKRIREDKIITDYIRMNYKRCIQCKRCVHFCQDIDGSHLIKFVERGADTRIEGFPRAGVADRFSGNTIDMCPVGALTARSTRFFGRPWEQEYTSTVGSLDSVGANIHLCARLGEIARIIPQGNPEIENGMIDDATRFSWEHIDDPRRKTKAVLNLAEGRKTVSRTDGEAHVAERLAGMLGEYGPDSAGVIAGGGLNNEEYLALRKFCAEILDTSWFHFGDDLFGDEGLNRQALGILTDWAPGTIRELLHSTTVLSIGCDLFEEAPSLGLQLDIAARRGMLKLLSARSHGSECDRFATFEAYGYGNQLRFVRGLANALNGAGNVPDECAKFAESLKSAGEDCAIVFGSEIWKADYPAEMILALENLRAAVSKANSDIPVRLYPVYPQVNSVGAMAINWIDEFRSQGSEGKAPAGSIGAVLDAVISGKVKYLLVFDADLLNTYPDRSKVEQAFDVADMTVFVGPFSTETADLASVHLPLGTFAHREGTVINLEWRLQARYRAEILSRGVSVTDIVNSLASAMGKARIAESEAELITELAFAITEEKASDIPPGGYQLRMAAGEAGEISSGVIPEEVKAGTEEPFVLIPKRFLYNDRPEIRYSPVFDRVAKPFCIYVNPMDMKVQNLSADEEVTVASGDHKWVMILRQAHWVRQGSAVVNDYCASKPFNGIGPGTGQTVSIKRRVEVGS